METRKSDLWLCAKHIMLLYYDREGLVKSQLKEYLLALCVTLDFEYARRLELILGLMQTRL